MEKPGAKATPAAPDDAPRPVDPGRGRYLHLFALSSLAIAQPLFDLLARDAEFFVVRRSSGAEILALAFALVVVAPLPLVASTALARRVAPRFGTTVHSAAVAVLVALLALRVLTRFALLDGLLWATAGLAVGSGFAWAYHRFAALRLLTSYLGVALVAVPGVFLLDSRISKIFAGPGSALLSATDASTPVVVLLFDELSLTALLDAERRIDPVSFPNLAALAAGATWFPNAVTVSDVTELAVPAILTGKMPDRDRLPILEDHPKNLFTALGGYELWAAEPITRLCPADLNLSTRQAEDPIHRAVSLYSDLWIVYLHLLLPPRYAGRLPVISDRWQDFGGGAPRAPAAAPVRPDKDEFFKAAIRALRRDRRDELRRFVAAFDPGKRRALYFLHVLLPHTPWEYLPSGKIYWTRTTGVPGLSQERWVDDETAVVQAYQRYMMQVRFVDLWIGRIVDRLRELDLYDRSLIVVAADHGVSFRPGDSRRVATETNYADVIPVPLLIKAPHQQRGRVVEREVSTIDIVPTIFDLIGAEPPWPMDGRSAFAPDAGAAGSRRVIGKNRSFEIDDSLHRDKYAALDWKLETFGAEPGTPDLLRAGSFPELVGRDVERLGYRRQDRVTVSFEGESLFRRHELYSPAFITGGLRTEADDTACCDLAIAVNGTIRATARSFGSPPADLEFTALVPDEAFGDGDNRVSVFRVRRTEAGPELELLGSSRGGTYALGRDAAGAVTSIQGGERRLPIRDGALRGDYTARADRGKIAIRGWAVDLEAGAEPERILVFHRGALIYGGSNTRTRDKINAKLGLEPTLRSEFSFDVPLRRAPDVTRTGLRVFAVSDRAATELGFRYRLVKARDGRLLGVRVTNGREIPIVDGALEGWVEMSERRGERLVLAGWAADVTRGEPPERVLIFADGKLVRDFRAFRIRRDVAQLHAEPEIVDSGFRHAHRLARAEATPEILVVAVSRRGEATVLRPVSSAGAREGSP